MTDVPTGAGTDAVPGDSDQQTTIVITPLALLSLAVVLMSLIGSFLIVGYKWGWSVGALVLCAASYIAAIALLLTGGEQ